MSHHISQVGEAATAQQRTETTFEGTNSQYVGRAITVTEVWLELLWYEV